MSDEHLSTADLNRAAVSALIGLSSDWRKDLANLLRSEAEVSRVVRDLLADSIEGISSLGIEINMKNHDATAKRVEGLQVRKRWMEDGRWIAELKSQSSEPNILDFFAQAAESTGLSEDYCKKCYYYDKKFQEWAQAEISNTDAKINIDVLESTWHLAAYDQKSERPSPPRVLKILEVREARLQHISKYFRGTKNSELAVDVILAMSEIWPQDRP